MKKVFLKVIFLSIALGLVSLVHADPKPGLWNLEVVTPKSKYPDYTAKYTICIQHNRTWYIPTSFKMKPKVRRFLGKKGTWSSNGGEHLLLAMNPAGTSSLFYLLGDIDADNMIGRVLGYSSNLVGGSSPAVGVVSAKFHGSKCSVLNY